MDYNKNVIYWLLTYFVVGVAFGGSMAHMVTETREQKRVITSTDFLIYDYVLYKKVNNNLEISDE